MFFNSAIYLQLSKGTGDLVVADLHNKFACRKSCNALMRGLMEQKWMHRAIELAENGMKSGHGGPFGCVIVKNGKVISEGYNEVLLTNDPTSHAEMVAIRKACKKLNSFQLTGCDIYASCEPCPMCLGAIYWARPERVFFAATRQDAARIGFDDEFIYEELQIEPDSRSIPMLYTNNKKALELFKEWAEKEDKTEY
jgi:tRNA(Arg) A34 adenosine deaminase TadA